MLMAKLVYNNAENISMGYTSFKFNYGFYFRLFSKKDINSHLESKAINKLANELRDLMFICKKNF